MLEYINFQENGEKELIKISDTEYEEILTVLRQLNAQTTARDYKKPDGQLTPDRLNPPTIEELESHHVRAHLKEYLPMLIYFGENEFYNSENPEFQKAKNYIKEILAEQLVVETKEDASSLAEVFNTAKV